MDTIQTVIRHICSSCAGGLTIEDRKMEGNEVIYQVGRCKECEKDRYDEGFKAAIDDVVLTVNKIKDNA